MRTRATKNKVLSIILGASLLIPSATGMWSTPVQAAAATGTSSKAATTQTHWAGDVLKKWQDKGLIQGDTEGNLLADAPIKRSELAAFINRSFQLKETKEVGYKDVKGNEWFYAELTKAAAKGYMHGYTDGTFKPSNPVTRQELAVILTGLLGLSTSESANQFADTASSPAWSKGAIGAVIDRDLMQGNGAVFRPLATATRAEVVTVLDRALSQASGYAVTYDQAGVYGPSTGTETIQGSVIVSAADVTLKNLVIEGDLLLAEGIGEGDVTLDHVTVKGTTTIEGGGKNSIHIADSVLLTVIVNKKDGSVRLVAEGNSTVTQVTLQSGAILEEAGQSGEGFKDLILSDLIPSGSEVSLAGTFENVDVVATQLSISLDSGSINGLTIGETAANNDIQIGAAAQIASLILNAAANVGGEGRIGYAEVNASGSTLAQTPDRVEITNGSTANIGGSSASTGSTGSGSTSSSGSSSGSNGGSTVTPDRDQLVVTNGKATLHFAGSQPSLTLADLNVAATVASATYELKDLAYNGATKQLTFSPVPLSQHYGEQLSIQVTPATGVTSFSGSLSGSVRLEGFSGTIGDVDDQPVAGMTIHFRRGFNNMAGAVAATAVTDANGRYTVSLPAGIYTGELSKSGFINGYLIGTALTDGYNQHEDATAIKVPESGELRIVLTWDEFPYDEDSHLVGPTPVGQQFHTWYGDTQHRFNGELYADLDHDDVDSYGPETTTIRKRVNGVYTFYVHNFSENGFDGTATLRKSNAKVEVYDETGVALKTYHIPTGNGSELYWYVFDMELNGGNVTFTDKNTLSDEAPAGEQPEVDPGIIQELDKLKTVTEVTYDVPLNGELELLNAPLSEGISLEIAWMRQVEGYSVTDDVYLEISRDAVKFIRYNDSGDDVAYDVEIQLHRDGQIIGVVSLRIFVPTLDDMLRQAYSAIAPLRIPELADEIDAIEQLLEQGGTTEDKQDALQDLLSSI